MLTSLLSVIAALPVITAGTTQLAGNENYARDARRSLERRSASKRSSGLAFDVESVSFEIGDKQYLSPTGSLFKSYSIPQDWGLEEYKGKTLPVTVFKVDGEVTCDVLGKAVEKYTSADDVWDEVSILPAFFEPHSPGPGIHGGDHAHYRYILPCSGRCRRLLEGLGWISNRQERQCHLIGQGYWPCPCGSCSSEFILSSV